MKEVNEQKTELVYVNISGKGFAVGKSMEDIVEWYESNFPSSDESRITVAEREEIRQKHCRRTLEDRQYGDLLLIAEMHAMQGDPTPVCPQASLVKIVLRDSRIDPLMFSYLQRVNITEKQDESACEVELDGNLYNIHKTLTRGIGPTFETTKLRSVGGAPAGCSRKSEYATPAQELHFSEDIMSVMKDVFGLEQAITENVMYPAGLLHEIAALEFEAQGLEESPEKALGKEFGYVLKFGTFKDISKYIVKIVDMESGK